MKFQAINTVNNITKQGPHRVLIVGCAYGGISAVVNLLACARGKPRLSGYYPDPGFQGVKSKRGMQITVIDDRDGYFHSVGVPLAHVTKKYTSHMWKRFSLLNELKQPNLTFRHGHVEKVDPDTKVAEWRDRKGDTQREAYDYLIVATGLKRHWPAVPKSGSYEEYLQDGKTFIEGITGGDAQKHKGRRVVIIGAGAINVTLVHSRAQVLSSEPLPSEVKERTKLILEEEGVNLILGHRAAINNLPDGKFAVAIGNDQTIKADFVIDCTTKGSPTTDFLPAECLNTDGEITVHQSLMFKSEMPNASSHFGVGDVIAWTGIKRAGGAKVMGQTAAHNIYAAILNSEEPDPSATPRYLISELPAWSAVLGLAVGKQCLLWDEGGGVRYGVDVMESYFGEDLGWAANLKSLGLTDVEEDVGLGSE